MYRSGSTFIFNLLKHIVKHYKLNYSVRKHHEEWLSIVKPEDISVYTYRDVRFACASMMRKNNLTVDNFNEFRGYTIDDFICKLINHDNTVKQTTNNLLKLKYETDILNIDRCVVKVLLFLNLQLDNDFIQFCINKLDLNTIKTVTDNLLNHQPETEWWPNHVSTEYTDYKTYFNMSDLTTNTYELLTQWLTVNNYLINL